MAMKVRRIPFLAPMLVIALASAAAPSCRNDATPATPTTAAEVSVAEPATKAPIGEATMLADGTIVLDLVARAGGTSGESRITYPPDHPEHQKIVDHLGGLRPGEHKLVPPWPDEIDDRRVEEAVHAWVARERSWPRDAYSVEIVGTDSNGEIAATVVLADDASVPAPAGGRVIALRLAPDTYAVLREMPVR